MGGVYQELMAAEKKMDGFIDACKREELKEGDVGKETERYVFYLSQSRQILLYALRTHFPFSHRFLPQLRHLAEVYMPESDYDVAELQYGDIHTLDVDLDSILVCIAFAKQTIAALEQDGRSFTSYIQFLHQLVAYFSPLLLFFAEVDPNADLSDIVFRPLQNLMGQARTAKVISKKLLRRLQDLMRQSSSLNPNHSNAITVLKDNTYDLANVSSRVS